MSANGIKQVYKSRAEAYGEFIQAQGYPISQSKFYQDCARLKLVQLDKTVHLASLLAYVKSEIDVDPVTNRSFTEERLAQEKAELEVRKLRVDVELKEKANRKDDAKWMEVVDHETQMAAFAGLVEATLRQFTTLKLNTLIYLCNGNTARASEFNQGLEDLYAEVFTDVVREQTRVLEFEEDGDDW